VYDSGAHLTVGARLAREDVIKIGIVGLAQPMLTSHSTARQKPSLMSIADNLLAFTFTFAATVLTLTPGLDGWH
jgi:hypothetical protein